MPALEPMLSAVGDGVGPFDVPHAAAMALANAALPDDSPHRITAADVVALVQGAETIDALDNFAYATPDPATRADADALRRLAAKLRALLPPEHPPQG